MKKKLIIEYLTSGFLLNLPMVVYTGLGLIALPIILANLRVADYGKWQFVIALQIWVAASTGVNITNATKRGISQGLNGTFIYTFLARAKLLIPASVIVLILALYLKFSKNSVFSILLIILVGYLLFGYLFQTSFFEFLIAKKRFKEWSFWQILIAFISVIGSTVVAYVTKNIIYFALFQLGSTSFISITVWFLIVKKENLIESYKKGEIDNECLPYGLKLIPVDLITATAEKISHFIIGLFFGFTNLAIFSVANKLSVKCLSVIRSSRSLLYADFAKMKRHGLIRVINRHLVKIGTIGILVTLLFVGAGWLYIKFFLPQAFHRAIIYFTILAWGLPAGLLAVVLHTVLESHLRYKELIVIGVIPNILKIIFILVFGYFWQILGVCIAWVGGSWCNFAFYYFLTVKMDYAQKLIIKYPILERLSHI